MLEQFQDFIRENELVSPGDKVLLAVSGGVDSVVMLDLFHRAGYPIAIAHVNFQLRGEESDEDERFVRSLAEKYGVTCFVKHTDTLQYAAMNKLSIQEAAREIRYRWFEEICRSEVFEKVAVAQHADDQIETFFINLLRGSGVAGLKGMPVKRGLIIRPLLFAGRQGIEQYAKERELSFREDSSNLSDKYLRNRVRHHLLPELEKIKEDYRQSVGKSIRYLTEDHQLLEYLIGQKQKEFFLTSGDEIKIPVKAVKDSPDNHAFLYYLLRDYGFHRDVSDSICEVLQKKETGKIFHSSDYRLLTDREFLILKRKNTEISGESFYIRQPGNAIDTPVVLKSEVIENPENIHFKNDPATAYFDLDKLTFPLVVRKWRAGDRFAPFGMKGAKLVSDYLIDSKVNRFEKENVYVMESAGKIIWIIGYRVSEDFKISEETKKVIVFRLGLSSLGG
ncbi:MAG: tRNA lysidine(34) synthetase TilS [Chlorobi bacterium]|nr:tRNA lysidine(34) synthetase TilS [Chlorobiota bacterium]